MLKMMRRGCHLFRWRGPRGFDGDVVGVGFVEQEEEEDDDDDAGERRMKIDRN